MLISSLLTTVSVSVSPETMAVHLDVMKIWATALFGIAVLHTFLAPFILRYSHRFSEGSIKASLLHFLGEVETVFGLWAMVLVVTWMSWFGADSALSFVHQINFAEPVFVFAIMCVSATKPVLMAASFLIEKLSFLFPFSKPRALYTSALIFGPLLGSVITEPAAMTVTALILFEKFYQSDISSRLRYVTIALLFVNVSIGGTLTHFAAPPVLMVAAPWGWDTPFMFTNFGDKAVVAVVVNTLLAGWFFRHDLKALERSPAFQQNSFMDAIYWKMAISHVLFLVPLVFFSHHIPIVLGLFVFFLGWHAASTQYQDDLRLKESLLVAFFLSGLVVLGKLQGWWLQPIIAGLDATPLFLGATLLTAVTDNAALTYLATLVPDLSMQAKYSVVAGAVTGGGLTLIANAPNLAGYAILNPAFKGGMGAGKLFISALPFTAIAAAAFLFL